MVKRELAPRNQISQFASARRRTSVANLEKHRHPAGAGSFGLVRLDDETGSLMIDHDHLWISLDGRSVVTERTGLPSFCEASGAIPGRYPSAG